MVLHSGQCYISSSWMLPKARTSFYPAVLFILVSVLQDLSATSTSLKGQKVVFQPNGTNEYGTLSPGTMIGALKEFTLCVDIRLRKNNEQGVAVFTYNTDNWSNFRSPNHELGIMVKKKELIIWLFRQKIKVKKILPLHVWHSLCLTWNYQNKKAQIYVNKTLVGSKNLGEKILGQNGTLVLGRKHRRTADRLQVDLDMTFVGDLYLFRLWDYEKNKQSISVLNCEDGNVITWDSRQWDFMGTILEYDATLICCEQFLKLRFKHSEYEHHGARISRRLLADDSTDSLNTTVFFNNTTVAPTTSITTADILSQLTVASSAPITTSAAGSTTLSGNVPINNTESSTLNAISVAKSATEPSTLNVTSTPLNSTESSTATLTSQPKTTTENKRHKVTSLPKRTKGNNKPIFTTSPKKTTGISTLTVTSQPQNITGMSTYTVSSQTQNATGMSTLSATSQTQNTTGMSRVNVSSQPQNITGMSTLNVTSQLQNTGMSTLNATSQTQNTTENSTPNVTSTPYNTTESPSVTITNPNNVGLNASAVAAIVNQLDESLQMEAIDEGLARKLIGMISTLLSASPDVVASFSTRLIQSVDTIGLKLNFTTESINITSSSLALAVSKINTTDFGGAEFSISNITNLQFSVDKGASEESFAAIRLPPSLLNNLTSEDQEEASRVQFTFYERSTFFQDPSMGNTSVLNSYIIASSIANLSIANLMDPVQITFRNFQETPENNSEVQCVFWDFSENNGAGGWNSDGCETQPKDSNETICKCDHLTHFGILLTLSREYNIDAENNRILTFITYIGCGLSSILLAATLVTYLAFEKLRRDYPSKILINLCAALLLLNMTFLIDSWISAYGIKGLCIAVAVFLHYFLLVSFTWMSLGAFHMYLALVKVFNTYVHKYMLKFCIIGWGTPIIVIAIILGISPDKYGLGHYDKYNNSTLDTFCWITDDTVYYVAAVAYFCVTFLLNVSMFIVVMIQFCRIKNQKHHQNTERNILQDIKSVTGLTFLLGITWGFAFFAWHPVNIPFMYLFAIFNTLQGSFIFIFHCLAKENVQKQWRRYLCCGKLRLAENSDWSRTATNNTKKLQPLVQAMSSSSTSNNSLQSNSSLFLVQEYSGHPKVNGAKV